MRFELQNTARLNLRSSQASVSMKPILGTGTSGGGGTGDASGPASSSNDNLAAFDGTTGKLLKDSGLAAAAVVTLTGTQTLSNKTFTAPALGTPASGTLTNCTGLPGATGLSGTVDPARLGSGASITTKFLRGDSTWQTIAGTGDVVGPASSTNNNVALMDGTTGKLIKDGGKGLPSGAVVGTTDSQTLTNKSIDAAQLTGSVDNARLDADLTAIAAISPANDDIIQRKSGAWVNRTMAQLKTDLAIVVANISDFASSVASAISTERTAVATYTNKDLSAGTNTFPTFNQSTTGSAATLTTSRTIGTLTGDVTSAGSGFNGSANNTNATTLATVNANTGSFGSATQVATFTVNAKGLITAAGATSIAIPASAVTDFSTAADARIAAAAATGTGSLVRASSPTLVTPALGTPSSATLTNATGLPVGGISATGTPSGTTYLRGDGTWSTPAGGGGGIASVVPGTNIDVDNTDPANPVVSVEALALADIGDVTASAAEVNVLDGVTSSTAELNILDGVTATAAELNALDGITATVTELNYTDGVTSAIQGQIDGKASTGSVSTVQTNLDNHVNDTTAAHNATAVFFDNTLEGWTSAADVQNALDEAGVAVNSLSGSIATLAPLASPTFTGTPVIPNAVLDEKSAAASGTSGTVTLDLSVCRIFTLSPSGNVTTLTISNVPASGRAVTVTLRVSQGATPRTIATPTGGAFFGAATPTQVANKRSLFTYFTVDGGTTWDCTATVEV